MALRRVIWDRKEQISVAQCDMSWHSIQVDGHSRPTIISFGSRDVLSGSGKGQPRHCLSDYVHVCPKNIQKLDEILGVFTFINYSLAVSCLFPDLSHLGWSEAAVHQSNPLAALSTIALRTFVLVLNPFLSGATYRRIQYIRSPSAEPVRRDEPLLFSTTDTSDLFSSWLK